MGTSRAALCFAVALVASLGSGSASYANRLPVVGCKTVYGVSRSHPRPPASLSAPVAASRTAGLQFYSVPPLAILAPKRWVCNGIVAADGNTSISVYNPRGGFFPDPAGSGYQPDESVTAFLPSAGTNNALAVACLIFDDARYLLKKQGLTCEGDATPLGEHDQRVNVHLFRFQDPPRVHGNGSPSGGPNPATGFVVWLPAHDNHGKYPGVNAAATATCSVPAKRLSLCATILNDFLHRWPH